MYADIMTWEQVDVDCPQQSKYVFFTTYLHMPQTVRSLVQLLMFLLNVTVAHAVATIVASSSWSSGTCSLSQVVWFVSRRLTCGTCARNALPISSLAKFTTSLCSDQPAPTPPLSYYCLFPFKACMPSLFILPYKFSYVQCVPFKVP